MKAFLKKFRADFVLSSLICIALGVMFIVWPMSIYDILGIVLAVLMMVIGVISLSSFFLHILTNGLSAFMGAIAVLIGIWILIEPTKIATMIPIVLGVLMIWHGVRGMSESIAAKKFEGAAWGINFALAVINIVLGIIFIVDAFGVLNLASIAFGICLIFNGISNIWVAGCATHYERRFDKNHPIDVEFIEEDK